MFLRPSYKRSLRYCAPGVARKKEGLRRKEQSFRRSRGARCTAYRSVCKRSMVLMARIKKRYLFPERKKKSGPEKMRTSALLQQVQELVQEDPMKSLRQLVRELDVRTCLIRQAVHEDLNENEALQQKLRRSGAGSTCT